MTERPFARLIEKVRNIYRLKVESYKLTFAENLTLGVGGAILGTIMLFFSLIVFFFVSVALCVLLADAVGWFWSPMIIAGAYLLLFVIVVLFRRPLIFNPVARFITRKIYK